MAFIRLLLLVIFLAFSSIVTGAEETKRVLVIHSYDPAYSWTQQLQKGIEASNLGQDVKLSIEYLDTKRVFTTDYLASVRHYFELKYHDYPFDGIIVTDDNALDFLTSLDMPNLRNLPTVAVGINDLQASLQSVTNKGTIIYEKDRIKESLQLISKLQPHLKKLYYLADHSPTAELIANETRDILKSYPNVTLIEVRDLSLQATQELLEKVSPTDAVLLTHYNTERGNNVYHDYNEIAEAFGAVSQAPIFVFWKFYIQSGILGGAVTDSYQLGHFAGEFIDGKLSGMVMSPYQANLQSFGYVFDYNALLKYHIDQTLLPPQSLILNQPRRFVDINLRLLLISSGIILALILIIFVLILALGRKRIINRQNEKILSLQKKTVDVQKELIHLLGDAIETRSGETGNHVKRVAKMSALLGQFAGLTPAECEALEVVSPMHDIGKIGIPEAILEKPGKLDPDEWEIMKGHVGIGYKILSASEGEFLDYAAIIALEHHERWDGQGYPSGKSGEQIHLYARITTIVDVFDALLSVRCYKPAWPVDKVIELFEEQKGKQFDPRLTQIVLKNLDAFIAIRQHYPDVATF
ncbi:HD domain-containing phosphohydrolase [Vibrio tritonius]|uniref:HD domain-containing phosphohydrolase n=1 Tax=Vibrio tritonius TaxID=1435069 RepID=UPI00315CD50D